MRVGRNTVLALLSCSMPGAHAMAMPPAWGLPPPSVQAARLRPVDLWAGVAVLSPTAPVVQRDESTPLLDRQLGDQRLGIAALRRRAYRLDIGSMTFGVEMLRVQPTTRDRYAAGHAGDGPRKSWSLGVHGDWQLGSADRLSLGLASGQFRSLLAGAAISRPQQATSLRTLALDWTHDEHWQAGLGWQQSSSGASRVQDRIVQLARGDAPHEAGLRATLAYLPRGDTDPLQSSFGIAARRAKLAPDDLAAIAAQSRQDSQVALFLRTRF